MHRLTFLLTVSLLMISGTFSPIVSKSSEPQVPTDEKVVGIRVVPPFVIEEDDGTYSGLTIALWEHIAEQTDIDFAYSERSLQGLIEGVQNGELYASAAALTITSDREELVDFTHPFYVTGLGIAVSYQPAGFWQSLTAMFSPDFLWIVLLLLLLILFWGFLVWIFERQENSEEFGGTTAEGVGSGFWWAAVTMTTVGYGDKSPRTLGGRIVGFIWMFTAIIVISFFTASIASSLTINQLDSRINGPEDLPNVRVGALAQSATLTFLEEERISATTYASISEGLQAVENEEIDAFVHDAPIIQYYTQIGFRNRLRILPNTFNDQYYGIVLPLNSTYRNEMNQILLDYIASDDWNELVNRYLGN